ncbi:hypothetical protein NG829_03525 [Xanthomonas sacchari]|uniref:hypothetical protein n=1 Tax=Xanthomonas sacchari TaxID=56458 RepID=UPI00225DF39B|nr:hypothetical protein [Xanthomonas sacchari]UYK81398.1 hypothetical protein NG829_03525 [Xanthomonas sacchari]
MSIRADEHALIASLEVVQQAQAPADPPLFDSLEKWGYAKRDPHLWLTVSGARLLDELKDRRDGKSQVAVQTAPDGSYQSPYQ